MVDLHTFRKSGERPITRVSRPFKTFMRNEAISGVFLISSVALALILSNTFLHHYFLHLWEIEFGLVIGDLIVVKTLHLWVNEFLMTLFFLLVGLEIKRELLIGELSSTKRALLPTIAALGGMIIPALIYIMFNPPGTKGAHGWAIPMATDIAFALGILYLLGTRVPSSVRIFLASLAIVDDIGSVLIIAFFYSHEFSVTYIVLAVITTLILIGLNKLGVGNFLPYLFFGALLWYLFLLSGLHATIAGVILAFTIPATTNIDFQDFQKISTTLVNQMNTALETQDLEGRHLKIYQNTVHTLEKACEDVEAPLQKLEHQIAPIVTFIIMPIFALSNAGVIFNIPFHLLVTDRIVLGVFFGLIVGKPLGIFGFTYLADKYGIVEKPKQVSWMQMFGVACLGGIGFTMSIFISALAFPLSIYPAGILISYTKIGILVASTISALLGIYVLTRPLRSSKPVAYYQD